jgi:hypothetical protein
MMWRGGGGNTHNALHGMRRPGADLLPHARWHAPTQHGLRWPLGLILVSNATLAVSERVYM